MALLGMALAIVIPIPAYKPFIPCFIYMSRPIPQKVGAFSPGPRGRSSSAVCSALLTESAGSRTILYRLVSSHCGTPGFCARRERRAEHVASLEVNHAAPPPVSAKGPGKALKSGAAFEEDAEPRAVCDHIAHRRRRSDSAGSREETLDVQKETSDPTSAGSCQSDLW